MFLIPIGLIMDKSKLGNIAVYTANQIIKNYYRYIYFKTPKSTIVGKLQLFNCSQFFLDV